MNRNHLIKRKSPRLKEFDYSEARPYFITICTKNKTPYFEDQNIAKGVIECLLIERRRMGYLVFAYCLMPDHIHLLLMPNPDWQHGHCRDRACPCPTVGGQPQGLSLQQFIGAFKSKSTHIFWQLKGTGKLWQGRFYDHIVRSDESLHKIANYILQNPVRKGLVEKADDYPYSGLADEIPM